MDGDVGRRDIDRAEEEEEEEEEEGTIERLGCNGGSCDRDRRGKADENFGAISVLIRVDSISFLAFCYINLSLSC